MTMLSRLGCLSVIVALLASCVSPREVADMEVPDVQAWQSVVVGVADMDEALSLWVGSMGMQVLAENTGPDVQAARLWNIEAGDIARQVVLQTVGHKEGLLHLVEFVDPDPPVREGAEVFDWLPKNLDVFVRDMPEQMALLRDKGYTFHSEDFSDVTAPNGIRFREIHMPAHDHINVVLLELVGATLPFSDEGFGSVGPLICIVPDAAKEQAFFRDVIGLEQLTDNILKGPEIEKMIGLPKGAALDVSIWGDWDRPLGLMEIIEYQGTQGSDLYPRARPKSLGILHVAYASPDLQIYKERLRAAQISYSDLKSVEMLTGTGDVIVFYSPAGLRVEIHEQK